MLIAGVPGVFSAGNDLADFLKAAENRRRAQSPGAAVPAGARSLQQADGRGSEWGRGRLGTTMLFHCDFMVAVRAYEDAIAFEPFADPRGYTGRSVFAQQARSNRPYPMACREL